MNTRRLYWAAILLLLLGGAIFVSQAQDGNVIVITGPVATVRLSDGTSLSTHAARAALLERARGAARNGRAADLEDLAGLLNLFNSDDPLGRGVP